MEKSSPTAIIGYVILFLSICAGGFMNELDIRTVHCTKQQFNLDFNCERSFVVNGSVYGTFYLCAFHVVAILLGKDYTTYGKVLKNMLGFIITLAGGIALASLHDQCRLVRQYWGLSGEQKDYILVACILSFVEAFLFCLDFYFSLE